MSSSKVVVGTCNRTANTVRNCLAKALLSYTLSTVVALDGIENPDNAMDKFSSYLDKTVTLLYACAHAQLHVAVQQALCLCLPAGMACFMS